MNITPLTLTLPSGSSATETGSSGAKSPGTGGASGGASGGATQTAPAGPTDTGSAENANPLDGTNAAGFVVVSMTSLFSSVAIGFLMTYL